MRSKSELVAADKVHARRIDYAYEQPLVLPNGRTRYPDFTIADHARDVTFYWEHLGMLDDQGYRARGRASVPSTWSAESGLTRTAEARKER